MYNFLVGKELTRRQFLQSFAALAVMPEFLAADQEPIDTRLVTHAEWIVNKNGEKFAVKDNVLYTAVKLNINEKNIKQMTKVALTARGYGQKGRQSIPDTTLNPQGGYPIWALADLTVNSDETLTLVAENPHLRIDRIPDTDEYRFYFTVPLDHPSGTLIEQVPFVRGDTTTLQVDFHGNGEEKYQPNVADSILFSI